MLQVAEFRGKEIAFLRKDRKFPKRGYQISNSENYETLKKMLDSEKDEYNTYVTIDTYENFPQLPFQPKKHWPAWKEWVDNPNKIIKNLDFMMDFDADPTIEGIIKAWEDVKIAHDLLFELIGEQAKYLTIWFSGNKGFHILGKCKVTPSLSAVNLINKQIQIAQEIKMVCPTLDITIYNLGRLRKLIGSIVYSANFGKTRVIPIANDEEFKELLTALKTKNEDWFNNKPLSKTHSVINNIDLSKYNKGLI